VTTMPADTASELERLAAAVARLRPDWRSADAFYEQRSEITAALRAIARNPVLVRTIVRFVRMTSAPLPPPAHLAALPRPSSRAACTYPSTPRIVRRHRYPHPGRQPGQAALTFESPR
jgi:hypothetical protein